MGRIVIVGYRPKPGKRDALRRLILDHVAILRSQGLVTDRIPITMEAQDGTIVEVFEWKSKAAIESAHTNPVVLEMWSEYSEVCDYIPVSDVPEGAQLFSEFAPIEDVRFKLGLDGDSVKKTKRPRKKANGKTAKKKSRAAAQPGR
jgi:quinol monooxygenase YgiN